MEGSDDNDNNEGEEGMVEAAIVGLERRLEAVVVVGEG